MIQKIKMLIFVFVMSLFGVATPAIAQENISTDDSQTNVVQSEEDTNKSEDKAVKRAERIEEYRAKKEATLTQFQKNQVKNRCKNAQGKTISLQAKVQGAINNRKNIHREIADKLTILIAKLEVSNIDTTELEAMQQQIVGQSSNLSTKFEAHLVILSDLSEMDCESDPEAFKAALDIARKSTIEIRQLSSDFRNLVTTELRTTLQIIRTQLAQQSIQSTPVSETQELTNESTTGGQ